MSYVVRHRMNWDETKVKPKEMHRRVAERIGTSRDHAEDIIIGSVREDWRNREQDLLAVSREFPGLTIVLDCEGEDGAKWVERYRDGEYRSQSYDPPEFDESLNEWANTP